MAWYWYITGFVTAITFVSLGINIALISGFMRVTLSRTVKEKIHLVYNWADDSGPISRVG